MGGPGTGVAAGVNGVRQHLLVPAPRPCSGSAVASENMADGREGPHTGKESLLHYRNDAAGDVGIHGQRAPYIGEADLSIVHFIV